MGQSVCRVSPTHFVPPDFTVPTEATFGDLRLVPLGPEHNEADYAAWTSSIDHIRATPGFESGSWPHPMSGADNLGDLVRHRDDYDARRGFTYTVLEPGGEIIGCVYIYPSDEPDVDARVQSWVSAAHGHMDRTLWQAVSDWLAASWPFAKVEYAPRSNS